MSFAWLRPGGLGASQSHRNNGPGAEPVGQKQPHGGVPKLVNAYLIGTAASATPQLVATGSVRKCLRHRHNLAAGALP